MTSPEKEKQKNYKVEWSFSFEDLGKRMDEFVKSLGVSGEEAIKTEHFSEPIDGATSASVRLNTPVGETTIRPAAGDLLFDAEITHVGEVQFAVNGETDKQITLSQRTHPAEWMRGIFGWIGSTGKLRWDIALTPSIPLDIDIHSGLGKARYDFRDLNLSALDIHGGTGEIEIILPASSQPLNAVVNGGVGEIKVEVPAGANVDLQLRAGTGQIDLIIGEGASVNARIKGGVGEFNVRVPEGAALHVEASQGLGSVNVPKRLTKLKGGEPFVGHNGVWETPDYETAEPQIFIRYDGGVGAFNVRSAESKAKHGS